MGKSGVWIMAGAFFIGAVMMSVVGDVRQPLYWVGFIFVLLGLGSFIGTYIFSSNLSALKNILKGEIKNGRTLLDSKPSEAVLRAWHGRLSANLARSFQAPALTPAFVQALPADSPLTPEAIQSALEASLRALDLLQKSFGPQHLLPEVDPKAWEIKGLEAEGAIRA
jgi:hypothetical protein